jgi:hypothetical protein
MPFRDVGVVEADREWRLLRRRGAFLSEQALAHGTNWCLEECGQRVHSSTQRRPREHFETEECPALLPASCEP